MSDASRFIEEAAARPLRPEERSVVVSMLGGDRSAKSLQTDLVADMSDGQMGSIRFAPFVAARRYGRTLASAKFSDVDGVPVSVALHADEQGDVLELDFWKVDFSPLKRYPVPAELVWEVLPQSASLTRRA